MPRKAALTRDEPLSPAAPAQHYLLPGRWALAGATLLLVPWLIAGALYLRATREKEDDNPARGPAPAADTPGAARIGKPGRWGQLETVRLVLSPPLEYIPDDPYPPAARLEWRFPTTSRGELEAFLTQAGIARSDVTRLLSGTRDEPRIDGLVVDVDHEIVTRLDPRARAIVYMQLAQSSLNPRQRDAPRFAGSVHEWLARSRASPSTLALVQPLLYTHGGFSFFADIDLVRSRVADRDELRHLAKALNRQSTLALRVRVGDPSRVGEVAAYWEVGGRRTDVLPLLESVAAQGPEASLDVTHLLPPFARLNLYRYPRISMADLEKPSLPNCFWSAFNFFNAQPDDRYLDVHVAQSALKRDYYLVHDQYQLGDIVVFSTEEGIQYHAASYLADGLIFGKNGAASLSPWTIVPIEEIKGFFPEHAGGHVSYYRRKDL